MEFDEKHLAKEAERLLKDKVLLHAIKELKSEAIEQLTKVDADNPAAILKWQAMHKQTDAVLDTLDNYILAISEE